MREREADVVRAPSCTSVRDVAGVAWRRRGAGGRRGRRSSRSLAASCGAAFDGDARRRRASSRRSPENHEIRSWGPASVVRTASTWDESAIASGIPCTASPGRATSPVAASTMRSDGWRLAAGRSALDRSSRGCTRCARLDAASWSAGSAPGSVADAVLRDEADPAAGDLLLARCRCRPRHAGRVDVLDVVRRVRERRPAPATPPSHWPVPSLAWASLVDRRSGPPSEAARTSSNGGGPLSCSVQRRGGHARRDGELRLPVR